jgi:hypothetical protein
MISEKRYHLKWCTTSLFLILALISIILYAYSLKEIDQFFTADGLKGLFVVFFLLVSAFVTRKISIGITDDRIISRSALWLTKRKELHYRNITRVYRVSLLRQSMYLVEGREVNKAIRIHISTHFDGWTDLLRNIVSKVEIKNVDDAILKALGMEETAPSDVIRVPPAKEILFFSHVVWSLRNLGLLIFLTLLSGKISDLIDPGHGVLTITVYTISWIVAFFLIGYITRVGGWLHILVSAAFLLIMSWLYGVPITLMFLMLFFFTMLVGGALNFRLGKRND